MRFELFIALRYLFTKREQKFISISSWVAVAGVAIGVAALVIVTGVMNGFSTDLRNKIVGITSHSVILSSFGRVDYDPKLLEEIKNVSGVKGATPFIASGVLASTAAGSKGVLLRGIDPANAGAALAMLSSLRDGKIEDLATQSPLPGIIIGNSLGKDLGLAVGSRVNLMSPTGQQSAAGFTPKIKAFRVVGIFSTGMYEYDSAYVFADLPAAADLSGWPQGTIGGFEVSVNDLFAAQSISDSIIAKLGPAYYARPWTTTYVNFFAALELEKHALSIILLLVVLVGAFSIITSLVMLVMEKTRDIAILMSIGAKRQSIRKIFTLQGLLIGLFGTFIGFVLGLVLCFLLKRYRFIDLPEGVYPLDYLPVLLETSDLVIICVASILLCFAATIYPSLKAASLEPIEALRHE